MEKKKPQQRIKQSTVIVEKFLLPNHLTSWYLSEHIASGTSQSPLCRHVGRLPAKLRKKNVLFFPASSAFGHLRLVRLDFFADNFGCQLLAGAVPVTDARHWGKTRALALWKPSGDASATQSHRSEGLRRLQVVRESPNRCLHEYKRTHWERWRATQLVCVFVATPALVFSSAAPSWELWYCFQAWFPLTCFDAAVCSSCHLHYPPPFRLPTVCQPFVYLFYDLFCCHLTLSELYRTAYRASLLKICQKTKRTKKRSASWLGIQWVDREAKWRKFCQEMAV